MCCIHVRMGQNSNDTVLRWAWLCFCIYSMHARCLAYFRFDVDVVHSNLSTVRSYWGTTESAWNWKRAYMYMQLSNDVNSENGHPQHGCQRYRCEFRRYSSAFRQNVVGFLCTHVCVCGISKMWAKHFQVMKWNRWCLCFSNKKKSLRHSALLRTFYLEAVWFDYSLIK